MRKLEWSTILVDETRYIADKGLQHGHPVRIKMVSCWSNTEERKEMRLEHHGDTEQR